MPTTLKTFELYVDPGDGKLRFEPLTCSRNDVVSAVQALIAQRKPAAVEVRLNGAPLFTILGGPPGRRTD